MKREVRRYHNLEVLSNAAAKFICSLANECVYESGLFTIVLSGSKTPKTLYENLARPSFSTRMPWSHIHLFWGDERCVPPDHPDSNFAMASRALVSKVPVPPQNVHPIPTTFESPEKVAENYEEILRKFFDSSVTAKPHPGARHGGEPFPSFDLILLGVGRDGHTASLFPGDRALEEERRWVAAVFSPQGTPRVPRITLTLPVINRARCVLFMASGSEKHEVIRPILGDSGPVRASYPAARVQPEGRVVWLIDEEGV
jgi:6-phosphogluconolactonase